jgi:hypothetical protein
MQAARAREIIKAQSRHATESLLRRERFVGEVYEPWHSDDGIADAIVQNGNAVFITSIDLRDYDRRVKNIVTEPPLVVGCQRLDGGEVTVRKGLELASGKIAVLLPVAWMAGPASRRLFAETPIARIYVLTRKLRFRPGRMAWYVFEKGVIEPPQIRWI